MNKDELIDELCRVSKIDKNILKNCMLCDTEHKVIADLSDIIEDEDEIRLTIFRIEYRKFNIIPF